MSAEPLAPAPAAEVTRLAGHPMLMSMIRAPPASTIRAASAIQRASHPAICTAVPAARSPSSALALASGLACTISWLATISLTTKPTPNRDTSSRNGRSVIPAMGASMTGQARSSLDRRGMVLPVPAQAPQLPQPPREFNAAARSARPSARGVRRTLRQARTGWGLVPRCRERFGAVRPAESSGSGLGSIRNHAPAAVDTAAQRVYRRGRRRESRLANAREEASHGSRQEHIVENVRSGRLGSASRRGGCRRVGVALHSAVDENGVGGGPERGHIVFRPFSVARVETRTFRRTRADPAWSFIGQSQHHAGHAGPEADERARIGGWTRGRRPFRRRTRRSISRISSRRIG